jgi:pyruvate dehydrogenase E2 component (dihydrolipoamide acetyltransferase)
MASDVIVPEVGELGMDVTFVRWLKAEGDEIAVGDELFEVDTEKSVMVVEAYAAGTLVDLRVGEGDIVAPRDVIARILEPGEDPNEASPPIATSSAAAAADRPPASGGPAGTDGSSSPVPAASPSAPGRAGVSPKARRIARELGVDTAALTGSGPDGLITEADVRAAVLGATSAPPSAASAGPSSDTADVSEAQVERARRAVAELTTTSWQTIPHFFLQLEADVERALALAKPTPLICTAVAAALQRHPEVNLGWAGDRPVRREGVDLGLLVDAPAGLLITVIQDAQELDLAGMAQAIGAAAARARSGTLSALDLGPRSLTVSNLGMYSVDRFTAVIPRPDVLTLAVGRTRTVPRPDGAAFKPGRVMDLTLSVDHRALDGAAAARFMTSLEAILADPAAEGLR